MAPLPPTRVVRVADGDAEGARGEPPAPKRRPAAPRAPRAAKAGCRRPPAVAAPPAPVVAAEALTPDGEARLRAELDELTQVKRPQVIARIRTAKEHGDLKENSEYHAAREEQSFLEGRIQAIEARLRSAVIVEAPAAGSRVGLGSVVTLDDDGETVAYTIVGADESDPPRGRISSSSPVGRALVGRDTGRLRASRWRSTPRAGARASTCRIRPGAEHPPRIAGQPDSIRAPVLDRVRERASPRRCVSVGGRRPMRARASRARQFFGGSTSLCSTA